MDCSKYLEMVSDEVDGELGEGSSLSLMRHLVLCETCRSEYSELLSLSEMLKGSAPEFPLEIPSTFTARVMALVEEEAASANGPSVRKEVRAVVSDTFLDKIRALSFPAPSLSWSFAASLLLVASLTFLYKGNNTGLTPQQMMTDAKIIKAEVLKQASASRTANSDSDFNYYVKRHVSALQRKPVSPSLGHGGAVVSYVSYESGALGNK